jgi:hypothetical protein
MADTEKQEDANDDAQNNPAGQILRPMMQPAEERESDMDKIDRELEERGAPNPDR